LTHLEYDAGIVTALRLIVNNKMLLKDIETYLHEKSERFKELYGIEAYDELEGMIDLD